MNTLDTVVDILHSTDRLKEFHSIVSTPFLYVECRKAGMQYFVGKILH